MCPALWIGEFKWDCGVLVLNDTGIHLSIYLIKLKDIESKYMTI